MTWKRQDTKQLEETISKFLLANPEATKKEICRATKIGAGDIDQIITKLRIDKRIKIYRVSAYALA
jgi:hypothetical protein